MMPILLLLLVGVGDLSRAFYTSIVLHEAAQAGALVAIEWQHRTDCAGAGTCGIPPCDALQGIDCANAQVLAAIKNSAPAWVPITDADIYLNGTAATSFAGEWGTATGWNPAAAFDIRVTHTFHFITPVIRSDKTLDLSATIHGTRNPA